MEYWELEELVEFYWETENIKLESLMKLFAFNNLESSAIASRGTKSDMLRYIKGLSKQEQTLEPDLDNQFKEAGFNGE